MRSPAVVIPSLGKPHLNSCLEFLRGHDFDGLHVIREGKSWPEAVNIGLSRVHPGQDVILMDDDVILSRGTFKDVPELRKKAGIIGFKLWFPDGTIQHAGGEFVGGGIRHRFYRQEDVGQAGTDVYLPHVTTSLCYITAEALSSLKGMATDYPGMQFEDVDFCFRAVRAEIPIVYSHRAAIHMESATKKDLPMFRIKMAQNQLELAQRHLQDESFVRELQELSKGPRV